MLIFFLYKQAEKTGLAGQRVQRVEVFLEKPAGEVGCGRCWRWGGGGGGVSFKSPAARRSAGTGKAAGVPAALWPQKPSKQQLHFNLSSHRTAAVGPPAEPSSKAGARDQRRRGVDSTFAAASSGTNGLQNVEQSQLPGAARQLFQVERPRAPND